MAGNRKVIGTYLLHNRDTNETYVGSGVLVDRKNSHFCRLETNTHPNKKLQAAYNQNPNFDFVGVNVEDREQARDFEQVLLDENWGNPFLLNISNNARAGVYSPTEETRQKLSDVWNGRKHSDESRAKMSESMKGIPKSDEHRRKISEFMKSRIDSPETLEKKRQMNMRRAVQVERNGIVFESLSDASRHLNIPLTTLRRHYNKGQHHAG